MTAQNTAEMPSQCRSAEGPKRCQPTAQETLRALLCARCHTTVYLCTTCDRGQRYCSAECARSARRQSQREADRRYQRSPRGRLKHAERSRRYRLRSSAVTEQGPIFSPEQSVSSVSAPNDASSALSPVETAVRPVSEAVAGKLECHSCRRWCKPWVRYAPLRHRVSGPRREAERLRRVRSTTNASSTRF